VNLSFQAFYWLCTKEVMRFWKVMAQTVLSPLVNASLYLLVFGLSLANIVSPYPGVNYLSFLVPGIMALGAYNNALQNSASSVMASKFHGDLQDLRLIPLSSRQIAAAYACGALIRGLLVASVIFVVGQLFHLLSQGTWLLPIHPFYLFVFLILGTLSFGNIGSFAGFISKSFDQLNVITNFIILPLIYLGGVFFSLSGLHPFWQGLSKFNPLLYLIHGLRWSFLGISDVDIQLCLSFGILFLVATSFLAIYAVKRGSYQRF